MFGGGSLGQTVLGVGGSLVGGGPGYRGGAKLDAYPRLNPFNYRPYADPNTLGANGGNIAFRYAGPASPSATSLQYRTGPYNQLRDAARGTGLDAHHVGQKALMRRFVPGYDPEVAPSILVPKVGHTIRGPNGIVSRSTGGFTNGRSVLARDIVELRRVYPDIPNSTLRELIRVNKQMYPSLQTRPGP